MIADGRGDTARVVGEDVGGLPAKHDIAKYAREIQADQVDAVVADHGLKQVLAGRACRLDAGPACRLIAEAVDVRGAHVEVAEQGSGAHTELHVAQLRRRPLLLGWQLPHDGYARRHGRRR